jgi:L-ascorbate metabolism protein UlaG (beta-lactamase superfamily)
VTAIDSPDSEQLETRIASLTVPPRTAACVWLGQGGYLFKSPQSVTVMVDAYLSDYAEEFWGVTRAIPPVIDPARLTPDVILVTHWHEDHLDAPTVRHYAQQPNVIFAGPESCVIRAQIWGWPAERTVTLERGDTHQFGDVQVTATFARHDEDAALTLDAVGFLLDIAGVRIWNIADSEYDAHLRPMRDERIDVMLVPINGVGGNMNAHEAALLTWHVAPRIAVPMHYGMWPDDQYGAGATLDPEIFRQTLTRLGGTAEVRVLEPGEIVLFTSKEADVSRS